MAASSSPVSDLTRSASHQRVRAGIGYVPQGREIFPRLTVQENLLMGLAACPGGTPVPERIFEMFPVLRQMLRRRGGDLSGGQQQQLAIGRALAMGPKLLILDEPTEGIQPSIIKDIERAIRALPPAAKWPSCSSSSIMILRVRWLTSIWSWSVAKSSCADGGKTWKRMGFWRRWPFDGAVGGWRRGTLPLTEPFGSAGAGTPVGAASEVMPAAVQPITRAVRLRPAAETSAPWHAPPTHACLSFPSCIPLLADPFYIPLSGSDNRRPTIVIHARAAARHRGQGPTAWRR